MKKVLFIFENDKEEHLEELGGIGIYPPTENFSNANKYGELSAKIRYLKPTHIFIRIPAKRGSDKRYDRLSSIWDSVIQILGQQKLSATVLVYGNEKSGFENKKLSYSLISELPEKYSHLFFSSKNSIL